jgi:hypothetical protein
MERLAAELLNWKEALAPAGRHRAAYPYLALMFQKVYRVTSATATAVRPHSTTDLMLSKSDLEWGKGGAEDETGGGAEAVQPVSPPPCRLVLAMAIAPPQ